MSLINDALKRARHAQQKRPTPSPSVPMRNVEPARPKPAGQGILLPVAFVVLALAGGLLIWVASQSDGTRLTPTTVVPAKSDPSTAAIEAKASAKPAPAAPAAAQTPVPRGVAESAPAPAPRAPTDGGPPAATAPDLSTAQAAAATAGAADQPMTVAGGPPPPPPPPKLQGIFYRPERPAALLDGRMVLIGKVVGEYRVADIRPQSVTVVRAGQTNVLEMPE